MKMGHITTVGAVAVLRKSLIALVASVALGAAVAPGVAAPHDGGGGQHGGFEARPGGGFHDGDGFRGGWSHAGHDGWGSRSNDWRPGFDPFPYAFFPGGPYDNDQCYQPHRVLTPTGWHWVCD